MTGASLPAPRVHPTAEIEDGVVLGDGTVVWSHVHVRQGTRIGRRCIVGEKSVIAYDVAIGNFVKINAGVHVCTGVTIEDFVMLSAHVVFTNDTFPRAGNAGLTDLGTSAPTGDTLRTRVGRGTTVGANATIGPGITLGPFSMVGMGAVVTRDVRPHELVLGVPARPAGWVCVCGQPVFAGADPAPEDTCGRCGRGYRRTADGVEPVADR